MTLLECLVALALCALLLNPLLRVSASLAAKHLEYKKTYSMNLEAERALELMGRAIRMAGYRNIQSLHQGLQSNKQVIEIEKKVGFQQSDTLLVRH